MRSLDRRERFYLERLSIGSFTAPLGVIEANQLVYDDALQLSGITCQDIDSLDIRISWLPRLVMKEITSSSDMSIIEVA